MSGFCALPAWALDDTPTQTPFLGARVETERTGAPVLRPQPARRSGADEGRRAITLPAVVPVLQPLAATPRPQPAVPLAPALSAAGRAPTALNRAIGLR
ncbi:MAG: hypothetical protein ACEQSK_14445 [Sphingomonadaceae bacterium]